MLVTKMKYFYDKIVKLASNLKVEYIKRELF